MSETTYGGDMSGDMGGEVRFSVELTRLDRLTDTYSLDVRRLNGNLNSYKYLYETFRQCVCFLSVWAVADVLFSPPQTYRFTAVEGWSRNFSLSLSLTVCFVSCSSLVPYYPLYPTCTYLHHTLIATFFFFLLFFCHLKRCRKWGDSRKSAVAVTATVFGHGHTTLDHLETITLIHHVRISYASSRWVVFLRARSATSYP